MSRFDAPRQAPPIEPPDGLWAAKTAAARLGIPAHLVNRWAREGRILPAAKMPAPVPGGVQNFYRLDEIEPHAQAYRRARKGRSF